MRNLVDVSWLQREENTTLTGRYRIISYSCCSIGRGGVMTWKSLSLRYWGNFHHDLRASVTCVLRCTLLPIKMDGSNGYHRSRRVNSRWQVYVSLDPASKIKPAGISSSNFQLVNIRVHGVWKGWKGNPRLKDSRNIIANLAQWSWWLSSGQGSNGLPPRHPSSVFPIQASRQQL